MSTSPTVKRMVMFKHGVAYLERSGPAEGSFELSFKKDEMNDVLKSLAVWVARGDARVGALAFEKPEDPEKALAARRLDFDFQQTLGGMLAAVRGRAIEIDTVGGTRTGEVLGAEISPGGEQPEQRTLVIRTQDGGIALIDFKELRAIRLLEPTSRADLEFLIDRRRAATSGDNRTVRVSVTGRADDLRVSYVIPAPTWRVSYRFARDADTTLIMAWGIIHNPADEDLNDIDLTLTTGQPVSFTIDLYNPKTVERVVVEESSRALASAPTQFERAPKPRPPGAPMAYAMPAAPAPMSPGFGPPAPGAAMPFAPPPPVPMAQAMAGFADDPASYEDRGELFEYRVAQKISLKRGSSAMVPLVGTRVDATKDRIWRDGGPPSPDLVLTFKNTSGAVLEEGPAVIYDDNVYAGEAMVPYSARGVEVKLAFAKDLGVRCKRTSARKTITTGVSLHQGFLLEEVRWEEHHLLRAESDHVEPVDVIFELPKRDDRSIDPAHLQPFEETSSYRRMKLTVPPHDKSSGKLVERWSVSQRHAYDQLGDHQLTAWMSNRFLDSRTVDQLREVTGAWSEAASHDRRRADVEREQQEAYAKQSKISEQLRVLKEGGPEGELRLRYVRELEVEQDKVNGCEREIRALRDKAAIARDRASRRLEALTQQH